MDFSPLRTLPPELRIQLYKHLLHVPTGIPIPQPKINTSPSPSTHPHPLLQTCRQFRLEGSALHSTLNTFILPTTLLNANIALHPTTGEAFCTSDVAGVVAHLSSWLDDVDDQPRRKILVHLGTWHTWWARAHARVVAEVVDAFRGVVEPERGRLAVGWRVEWCALPGGRREFEVRVELGRMEEGIEGVWRELERLDGWIEGQMERSCVRGSLETARERLEEVFELLEKGECR